MATELWIQIDDAWIPILSIPTDQFDRFTLRPLKWLRLLGIIYGHEGILRIHCDSHEVDNYDIGTSELRECYYFFSAGELYPLSVHLHFLFLSADPPRFLDTQTLHEQESLASRAYSSRREDFSVSVINRDHTCIVTDEPPLLCNPSHCLPHSKGDEVRL
jgi:hypothetical protein